MIKTEYFYRISIKKCEPATFNGILPILSKYMADDLCTRI